MRAPRAYARGEVVLVNLEPVTGSEQGSARPDGSTGRRPCVVLSDIAQVRAARARPLYLVVPLTRSTALVGPLAPRLATREGGVPKDSTALVLHLRSIDPSRIGASVGLLESAELEASGQGTRVLLGLP